MESEGFKVTVILMDEMESTKINLQIPEALRSCHTATIGGYIVEGHVSAAEVRWLLEHRPKLKGLFLPGMPVGSPGMEGPNPVAYDVLALDEEGKVEIFATHDPKLLPREPSSTADKDTPGGPAY